jgi:hypothetical protein
LEAADNLFPDFGRNLSDAIEHLLLEFGDGLPVGQTAEHLKLEVELLAHFAGVVHDDLLKRPAINTRFPGLGECPLQFFLDRAVDLLQLVNDIKAPVRNHLGPLKPHVATEVELQGLDPLGDGRLRHPEERRRLLLALPLFGQQAVQGRIVNLPSVETPRDFPSA